MKIIKKIAAMALCAAIIFTMVAAVSADDSEIKVVLNGEQVEFQEDKPIIDNGRTLVPFRNVLEKANAEVHWSGSKKTAYIVRGGIVITINLNDGTIASHTFDYGKDGKGMVLTSNKKIDSDVSPKLINDRIYIPLRVVFDDGLGGETSWDGDTRTVIITDAKTGDGLNRSFKERELIDLMKDWNYVPELATANVKIIFEGDFENALPDIGNGITVKIGDKTQTAADGGICTFEDITAGEYTLEFSNVPQGYMPNETKITVEAGKDNEIKVGIKKTGEAITVPDKKDETAEPEVKAEETPASEENKDAETADGDTKTADEKTDSGEEASPAEETPAE